MISARRPEEEPTPSKKVYTANPAFISPLAHKAQLVSSYYFQRITDALKEARFVKWLTSKNGVLAWRRRRPDLNYFF